MSRSGIVEAPSGRSELLLWLNSLCSAEYPAVESLRDGAAYCVIIEAAVSRAAQNCVVFEIAEAEDMHARATHAAALLSKLDWTATPLVCEHISPSQDTAATRAVCRRNMDTLQDMLHLAVEPAHRLRVDAERLAQGRLQDHVLFLRWLFHLVHRLLTDYASEALAQREWTAAPGEVEGVRLTRAVRLLERARRESEATPEAGPSLVGHPTMSGLPLPRELLTPPSREAAPARSPRPAASRPRAPPAAPGEVRKSARVPRAQRDSLLKLRAEVEALEAAAVESQETHRAALAHAAAASPSVSLPELGRLLEQRDGLSAQYSAVLQLVRQHGDMAAPSTAPTPLVSALHSIFRPEADRI